MRQLESTVPWEEIAKRYVPGTVLKSIVCHIADYGILLEIEPGGSGLVHISDLSWTKKPQHPSDFSICLHEEMTVVVLDVDEDRHRIALGCKQAQTNPWPSLTTVYNEGSVHRATVRSIHGRGIVAKLPHDVEVFVPWGELIHADQDVFSAYREGSELNLRVVQIDPVKGKLITSERTDEERELTFSLESLETSSDEFVDLPRGMVLGGSPKTGEQALQAGTVRVPCLPG